MNIQQIKNTIQRLLDSMGYTIIRVDSNRATMRCAIQRLAERNHSFKTVIDVGASDGRWSLLFMEHFHWCQYLLIEAQSTHEKALRQFCSEHKNAQFILAAAGETPGQINFDASDTFGGQASYTPYPANNIIVPVTTIDDEVQSKQLKEPYLIKFDTHGFEVPILRGALHTLHATEVIIMECYNFKATPEGLLFFEMCEYLKEFGFRCIDLVDPLYRPYDNSFWQMDLVFVKDSRPEFSYLQYR